MSDQDPISRLNSALEGRYRIERELGAGGMATVYLADDPKHGRKVALKVLKPELAAVVGADRFLAEIKTTANLQHPHILPLFDSGKIDSFLFYVMPYVEGESLRERLDREHQLPVHEAVRIAKNVAEALDYAHRQGVIHRDIKPGNVLIHDDQPVIADFGIALAVGMAGGGRLTETGLSVGTPYYMSPEQATGDQAVGPGSDVYALAAVLYEMLTGDPPYVGSTAQAVLGKILQGDPVSARTARKSVPAHVDAALRKGLEKLPADRFLRAQDFAGALTDPTFRHDAGVFQADSASGPWRTVSFALSVALFASLAWAFSRPQAETQPAVYRLGTEGWAGLEMPIGRRAALAPDGSSMILPIETADGWMLGLKLSGSADITPLSGTEQARDLVYSPDGQSIAFAAGTELKIRRLVGGAPLTLAGDLEGSNRSSLDWLDDGTILFEQSLGGSRQISRIPQSGGDTIQVVVPPANVAPIWVRGLPGARGALLIDCENSSVPCDAGRTRLRVVDLSDHSSRLLLEGVLGAWYVPTGHILYVRADGSVFAQSFDLSTMDLIGGAIPVLDGVRTGANYADLHISADGTLLYVRGPANIATGAGARALRFVGRDGREESVGFEPHSYEYPRFSPEGGRLATVIQSEGDYDLWVFDLQRGSRSRATFGGINRWYPVWTPAGDGLVYSDGTIDPNAIFIAAADGSGRIDPLLEREGLQYPTSWSRDGRFLAFHENNPQTGRDLWVLPSSGDPEPFLVTPFQEAGATFSSDGRWIAYVSDKSGRQEVYVRGYPGPGPEYTISTRGGTEPLWSPDGRELFYRGEGQLMAVALETEDGFDAGPPRPLFADTNLPSPTSTTHNYDISPDGQRFIMVRDVASVARDAAQGSTLILVENFFEELRQRIDN